MKLWTSASAVAGCLAFLLSGCQPSDKSDDEQTGEEQSTTPTLTGACVAERAADCAAIQQRIADLKAQRDTAEAAGDSATLWRVSLSLNRETEALRLIDTRQDTTEALQALDAKYAALTKILEEDLARGPNPGNSGDTANTGNTGNTGSNGHTGSTAPTGTPGNTGNTGTTPQLPAYVYHPAETQIVSAVMKEFGELWIGESKPGAGGAETWDELAVNMPWAGYWYPIRGSELFEGDESPLAKLDRAVANAGRTGRAVEEEKKHRAQSHADTWEGLCSFWAMASIQTPEPSKDVVVNDVTFTPVDQKALLTKIHERVPNRYYGVRYQGNADTDGTIQDLRPEAFHRLATQRLGVEKQPFIVDEDPGIEVWSKPVYRLRWHVKKDSEKANAFYVRAFPWMVRERKSLDATPTSQADRAAPAYEYRLYYDPASLKDGKYKVIAGEWVGRSRDSHPDAIVLPVVPHDKQSNNAGVNEAMDVVRQVVGLR